ncbi:MAG: polysaccharide biosynthesis tyrosine autokinase [Magnetospirillum sp.]|nr:polysaccharide biosynthesis tyrosine autokinase [Magnetospirillum sp.]
MVGDDTEPRGSVQALSVLWQRKGLIGGVVAAATGLAALALTFIHPRYAAEALIALNTRAQVAQELINTKQTADAPPLTTVLVATEMDILRSRGLASEVVAALALDRDPEFNTTLEKKRSLPAPLALPWGAIDRALTDHGDRKDAHTLTVDNVQRQLYVKNGADSYAIRVGFIAKSPEKAALIANAFADLYIRDQREAKLRDMHLATGWITQQIEALRTDLARDTEQEVQFRRQNKLAPVDTRDQGVVAAQQLISLNNELALVEKDRADAEAALEQARRALKSGGAAMTSLTFVESSPYLQEIRKQEARLLGKIAELSVGYRDDSPALQALKSQLGVIRQEINREIAGQVDMLANKAAQAKAREDALRERMRQINSGSAANDEAMSQLEQRQQVIKAKNTMLDSFLARYAELTNRAQIEDSDARVASRATAPAKPTFPKPFLFLGVAFGGSLGLSISLAFLLERFRSGFLSTRQVRDALGLNTLGIIPQLGRGARTMPGDYLVDKPESVFAEAMRSAQLAVLNVRQSSNKAVMVTSSLPGEGKTAFSVGLGRSLALTERKVLLIDADLRRPAVALQLDSYRVPGLSDFLREQASAEEIVRHDSRTGLDFVASGARTQDPQRLLGDPRIHGILERWLDSYELVLIDTPPVMVAFDVALLAAHCDFAAYVVEWNKTPRRAVEAGIEHLKSFDMTVGGIVLTKVDLHRQRQYSDYVDFCFRSSEYYGN